MSNGEREQVIIRPWPKVVFLYPVMVFSFLCGIWQSVSGTPDIPPLDTDVAGYAGRIFFVVLCLNILVISFEFSRFKTVAILFFLIAVFFLLLYLSTRWEVFDFLARYFKKLDIRLSAAFYYTLGTYFALIFVGVFISTRFNYWVIKSNEILHKEGFLGDVKRFPSPNLKMTKEIADVFEFLLLGAGKVVLYPASEKQAIVLDHVMWVNSKERGIQDLLSSLSVEISRDDDDDAERMGAGY